MNLNSMILVHYGHSKHIRLAFHIFNIYWECGYFSTTAQALVAAVVGTERNSYMPDEQIKKKKKTSKSAGKYSIYYRYTSSLVLVSGFLPSSMTAETARADMTSKKSAIQRMLVAILSLSQWSTSPLCPSRLSSFTGSYGGLCGFSPQARSTRRPYIAVAPY